MKMLLRKTCPSCSLDNFQSLYSCAYADLKDYITNSYTGVVDYKPLENETFCVNKCLNCGLIYQQYIPDDELLGELYDKWIDPVRAKKRHFSNVDLQHRLNLCRDVSTLVNYFNRSPSDIKVFDFGMGWGQWCSMAHALGCDSYGGELSKERIDYAISHGIKVVEWDDIPGMKFDFINTEQVFEHLTQPLEVFAHLKKGLNSGGLIRISVPNGRNIEKHIKKIDWSKLDKNAGMFNPIYPLEHVNCFTHESLVNLADQVGLEQLFIPMRTKLRNYIKHNSIKGNIDSLLRMTKVVTSLSTVLYFKHK